MDQALVVSGWVLGVGAVALIGWSLFWDRARGRRRCGRCWYDMQDAGPAPARCTECGREWGAERSLLRTRRRWRWAAAGVALAVAGVVAGLTPAYRAGRVMTLLPAWALVEMMPLFPSMRSVPFPPRNHPAWELTLRLAASASPQDAAVAPARPLSRAQIVHVLRRVGDGSVIVAPGSERWMQTAGEWLNGTMFRFGEPPDRLYPDGAPADAALERVLVRLNAVYPAWSPRTREAWPAGTGARIESGFVRPRWHKPMSGANEDAAWSVRGVDRSGVERGFLSWFDLPALGEPGDEIVLDLTLRLYETEIWDRAGDEVPLREESFVLRWAVTGPSPVGVGERGPRGGPAGG